MKGNSPLAVVACTTAECTRAVPSQCWILLSFKIHWYRKPGLSWSRHCISSPATLLKRKDRHKNSKEKEAHEGLPVEGKQYGALNLYRSWRTKGILVQGFQALHLKNGSLTEGSIAFCNTLTSPLTQESASAIQPAWNLQLCVRCSPTAKKGGADADRGMTMPRAAQTSEWLGGQLVLLKLPCQRPMPKAILGYMAKNLH